MGEIAAPCSHLETRRVELSCLKESRLKLLPLSALRKLVLFQAFHVVKAICVAASEGYTDLLITGLLIHDRLS